MLRPFVLFGGSEELTFPSSEAVYRKKPFPVDLSCVSDPLSINGNAQGSVKSDGENQTAARDGENQTAARDGENQTHFWGTRSLLLQNRLTTKREG